MMSLVKIVLWIAMVLFIYGGCCSSKFLPECSCELDVDTTEYLIPRKVSYTYPLDRDYITEEVNKDSIVQWVKEYYKIKYIEASLFWSYWEEAKGILKNQDRIFYYSKIYPGAGIEGLAIIRECKIILDITLLSWVE